MQASSFRSVGAHILRAAGLLLGGMIFLVGLLAPLTPSEGRPGGWEILLFVATPVLLCVTVAWSARNSIWRTLGIVQAVLIAVATAWLFSAVL